MGAAPVVLGIAGSPRRGGNTDRLLAACLAGAASAGASVRTLVAAEAGVGPCRGCNACSSTGECVLRDGMADVYAALDGADAIVVASPVYFATVPATLKALYDRCQPYWARRYVLGEPRPASPRPGAILLAGGGGDPFGSGCAETTTRSVFAVLSVSVRETLLVRADSPSDVGRLPEDLARAEAIGAMLAAEAGTRSGG